MSEGNTPTDPESQSQMSDDEIRAHAVRLFNHLYDQMEGYIAKVPGSFELRVHIAENVLINLLAHFAVRTAPIAMKNKASIHELGAYMGQRAGNLQMMLSEMILEQTEQAAQEFEAGLKKSRPLKLLGPDGRELS